MRTTCFLIFITCLLFACSRDLTPPVNSTCTDDAEIETRYSTNIKSIIDLSCGNPQCHDGSDVVAADYSTYEGLLPELENGEVWSEVFEEFDMPLPGSEGERNFSSEDMQLFRCWIENGYPE